jgi:hypothetical protein
MVLAGLLVHEQRDIAARRPFFLHAAILIPVEARNHT